MRLCERLRLIIELINQLLVQNLLIEGLLSVLDWTELALEVELVVLEDVLSRFS